MKLEEFIEEVTIAMDVEDDIEITGETNLANEEYFDSLAQLGLIVLFETEFQITLTPETLFANTIVNDLDLLTQRD